MTRPGRGTRNQGLVEEERIAGFLPECSNPFRWEPRTPCKGCVTRSRIFRNSAARLFLGSMALPPVTLAYWLRADLPRPLSPADRSNLTGGNVWLPAILGHCTTFQSTFPTYRRLASRCNSAAGSGLIISTGTNKENDQT